MTNLEMVHAISDLLRPTCVIFDLNQDNTSFTCMVVVKFGSVTFGILFIYFAITPTKFSQHQALKVKFYDMH